VCLEHESSTHYFSCSGRTGKIPEKMHRDTLCRTCIFVPGGIYRSRSVPLYVRGAKHRCTIFLARVGLLRFPQKRVAIPYAELVFLRPVVSVGHVVHSNASGARNTTQYFSCSGGTGAVSIQSASRQVTSNSCFCILWDMWVT
jgi:hypothetical protein